jgi:hypothetical protein
MATRSADWDPDSNGPAKATNKPYSVFRILISVCKVSVSFTCLSLSPSSQISGRGIGYVHHSKAGSHVGDFEKGIQQRGVLSSIQIN